jgi:hypothetical protein
MRLDPNADLSAAYIPAAAAPGDDLVGDDRGLPFGAGAGLGRAQARHRPRVLDLTELTFCDSSGLHVLLSRARACAAIGAGEQAVLAV